MIKRGVVLLSMGGAENREELKLFLKNMFYDRNILPIGNNFLRWVLSRLIANFRVDRAYGNYMKIGGSSPLKRITFKIRDKIREKIGDDVFVSFRYLPPYSCHVMEEMKRKGIEDVFLLPLYPHNSISTVKSSIDDFYMWMNKLNLGFNVNVLKPFYSEDKYNDLICKKIIDSMKSENEDCGDFVLLFSAHSIPEKFIGYGDTYKEEVEEHVRILSEKLEKMGANFKNIVLGYQSRLGPVKWVGPALEDVLKELEGEKVVIYPISFVVDNIETLYELKIEYKKIAHDLGILEYKVIKCPNASDEFVNFLLYLIKGARHDFD